MFSLFQRSSQVYVRTQKHMWQNKTTRRPSLGMCTTPQLIRYQAPPPDVRVPAQHVLRSSHLFEADLYDDASGPSGLQTQDMDRPQSLAPTPATTQNSQPDDSRACRECQRRRVKCDGSMPECAVCQRYRRHCLYDKHSRTRLTRKYAGPRSVPEGGSVNCD